MSRRTTGALIALFLFCLPVDGATNTGEMTEMPAVTKPSFPEDLGPSEIDVSGYPAEHQETYRTIFSSYAKFVGGPARLLNSPLIELDAESAEQERKAHPELFGDPQVANVSATAWKDQIAAIRKRPPCCGGCPYLTIGEARALWAFLVYDSRARKTGPQAQSWVQHRRKLIESFSSHSNKER
jgi:hypothetical protein